MLAGFGECCVDNGSSQRLHGLPTSGRVGPKVGADRLIGIDLVENSEQLLLSRSESLYLLLETVQDQKLDGVSRCPKTGAAGVTKGFHASIEHVEQYWRPRPGGISLAPTRDRIDMECKASEENEASQGVELGTCVTFESGQSIVRLTENRQCRRIEAASCSRKQMIGQCRALRCLAVGPLFANCPKFQERKGQSGACVGFRLEKGQ